MAFNKSSTKAVSTEPVSIKATKIEINQKFDSIFVGESKNLTATISPSNVTNKEVTWKSSDEDIAIISSSGKITAKKEGTVEITATTSNGKASSMKIDVIEKEKEDIVNENNVISENIVNATNTSFNNINENNSESSSAAGGVVTLGALGGGYYLYRKNKKNK